MYVLNTQDYQNLLAQSATPELKKTTIRSSYEAMIKIYQDRQAA